jgi:hypothetical protein
MMVFRTRKDPLVRTVDFHNVVPWEPIEFADENGNIFRCPPFKSKSDLASTPRVGWAELPPFGVYARASIPHDGGYQNWLERLRVDASDGRLNLARQLRKEAEDLMAKAAAIEADCWEIANLTKAQADTMFLDLMTADQVPTVEKEIIYEGVHLGGWKAFRDDRAMAASAK